MSYMFYNTGYSSKNFNTTITIRNPKISKYNKIFYNTAYSSENNIKVNYFGGTKEIVEEMIESNDKTIKGDYIINTDEMAVGDVIYIEEEKFNVISQTDNTITMLAQYNLGTKNRQSVEKNYVEFANDEGWEYKPGPKEIDIQIWTTKPKEMINDYILYLQEKTGDKNLSGNLITAKELVELGCSCPSDYNADSTKERTCAESPNKEWLITKQR